MPFLPITIFTEYFVLGFNVEINEYLEPKHSFATNPCSIYRNIHDLIWKHGSITRDEHNIRK